MRGAGRPPALLATASEGEWKACKDYSTKQKQKSVAGMITLGVDLIPVGFVFGWHRCYGWPPEGLLIPVLAFDKAARVTSLNLELDAKRLEILIAALPGVNRVGVLSIPHDRANRERLAAVERGARTIGVETRVFDVPKIDHVTEALDAACRARVGTLMILGSAPFYVQQTRIAVLAAKERLPVISAWREFPRAGGLMSYGTNVPAMYRRASSYVERILKGANPADLPVERAATFELVLNLKTAKALGLTIPQSLPLRADQVIQ